MGMVCNYFSNRAQNSCRPCPIELRTEAQKRHSPAKGSVFQLSTCVVRDYSAAGGFGLGGGSGLVEVRELADLGLQYCSIFSVDIPPDFQILTTVVGQEEDDLKVRRT